MSKSPYKLTDIDIIVTNLRAEIGEIVESWTLMREFYALVSKNTSGDIQKDIGNNDLARFQLIRSKFQNDVISRLSELGQTKFGRLNFHFAASKLGVLEEEVKEYRRFLKDNNFTNRRNEYISHKELPTKWEDLKAPHRISYCTILRGIAYALIIMKKIDSVHLGPQSGLQWIELRKSRYDHHFPASSAYMLLPHLPIEEKDNGT